MNDKTILSVIAILCLTALECSALIINHVDGAILMTIGALIAGIAGYEAKSISTAEQIKQMKEELEKLRAGVQQ